jgi:hypothetical protein
VQVIFEPVRKRKKTTQTIKLGIVVAVQAGIVLLSVAG